MDQIMMYILHIPTRSIGVVTADPEYALKYILNNKDYAKQAGKLKNVTQKLKKFQWKDAGADVFPIEIQDKDGTLYRTRQNIGIYLNLNTIKRLYPKAKLNIFLNQTTPGQVKENGEVILERIMHGSYHLDPRLNYLFDITDWEHVYNFESACRLNATAILTNTETPWNGKMDEESSGIADVLVALNNKGFLTTESQPGICDDDTRQRAYINGFMYNDNANRLMKLPIAVNVYNFLTDNKKQNKYAKALTKKGDIELTLEKGDDQTWEIYTSFPYSRFDDMAYDEIKILQYKEPHDLVFVAIQLPHQCDESLFMTILSNLKN